jgi:hypothetical protein
VRSRRWIKERIEGEGWKSTSCGFTVLRYRMGGSRAFSASRVFEMYVLTGYVSRRMMLRKTINSILVEREATDKEGLRASNIACTYGCIAHIGSVLNASMRAEVHFG